MHEENFRLAQFGSNKMFYCVCIFLEEPDVDEIKEGDDERASSFFGF